MWPSGLSARLLIVALVGRYPANWLIRRGPIPYHRSFSHRPMRDCALMRYYQSFPTAIPRYGAGCPRVTHPFATKYRHVFCRSFKRRLYPVRLACVRHAASVHPEPGSNSHVKNLSGKPLSSNCTSYNSVVSLLTNRSSRTSYERCRF